jgi:hypothetical protein
VQAPGEASSGSPRPDARSSEASSSGAIRAIVFAIAGFSVCALVAAAPGSPFQPVLPAGAEPGGPLTALASAIGLDRLTGSWLVAAGVIAAALAGWLAIGILLRYLRTHSTAIFIAYRLIAAAVFMVLLLASGTA